MARKIHSDIVVMGAISRTGIKRFLIGNTAERIIDDLSCDVLVVKPRISSAACHSGAAGCARAVPVSLRSMWRRINGVKTVSHACALD